MEQKNTSSTDGLKAREVIQKDLAAGISADERDIIRKLASEYTELAALPVHKEKAEMWRKCNDLETGVRPMVYANEVCWNEMDVNGELTCLSASPVARQLESWLRTEMYQFKHFPGDMILSDYIPCYKLWFSTGFGVDEDVDIVKTDETSGVVSRHFHRQILEPEDIDKIKWPIVESYVEETDQLQGFYEDTVGDIMPVKMLGRCGNWCAPWDFLIRLWGVQEAMIDLIERPDMVNAIVDRTVMVLVRELEMLDELNLLDRNDNNTRVGTGGYGYTKDLPGNDFDPTHVKPINKWGGAMAQIFSEVSPEMHWEFALKHEIKFMERFGMNYYGCCEPLDRKIDISRRIPNLRKISMSPWTDPELAAPQVGRSLVYSFKPNPAVLAEDHWRPEVARQEIRNVLEKAKGCNIEIIHKDISTVRYEPQRLWEWVAIAVEEAERIGGS